MKELERAQLAIVGAGPGGYTAAFRAADLGLEVAVIDAGERPGGVCLLRGCIPSKALLHAAGLIRGAEEAGALGLSFAPPAIDPVRLRAWKDEVVARLTDGLAARMRQKKIRLVQGRARLADPNRLRIETPEGEESELPFDRCILAAGSRAVVPPFAAVETDRVFGSRGALEVSRIPGSLLVVGGGYIGLELGSAYAALGSEVSVVEMLPQLMTGADRDLVSQLERRLKKQLSEILLETKVSALDEEPDGVRVTLEGQEGEASERRYDAVLVAVGRRPNSEHLGLAELGIELDERGFVPVDALRRTRLEHILAIGDLTGEPMLAHKAAHEGVVAAEVAAGRASAFEPRCIPAVCFTDPEIAWCGLTETEARERGVKIKKAKLPWSALGRTHTLGRRDGLTKLLVDPETDRVLGVGLAGVGAGELIAEAALAIEMAATVHDLRLTIHPHPTLSESIMEAAQLLAED